MLPLADVLHLFADELARRRARRFALAQILPRSLQRPLLRHIADTSAGNDVHCQRRWLQAPGDVYRASSYR